MSGPVNAPRKNRNARTAWTMAAVVGGMLGLAYASAPLYDLFCRTTGFGGTPRVEKDQPELRLRTREHREYRVLARGNTLALFLNGHLISMTIDENPVMHRSKGIIALQIEGGKWYFRNIWLKEIK